MRYRYDIALLYLEQANYDLDIAIEAYKADEKWERDHPMEANIKGKKRAEIPKRQKVSGPGFASQLS